MATTGTMRRPTEMGLSTERGRTIPLPELARCLDLVRATQEGSVEALGELFWRYRHRLRRILSVQLGARLRAFLEANEVPQGIYLEAMERIGELDLESHSAILCWLARIADDELRRKVGPELERKPGTGRSIRFHADDGGAAILETGGPQGTVREEFERLLDSYVERLEPSDCRQAILLRDYYGGDWEFVREQLGLASVEAARDLYRRAHEKLRTLMRPHLAGGPGG